MNNTITALTTTADLNESVAVTAQQYPQYAGYTEGWVLTIATRDFSTKGGLVMKKGDVLLVDPTSERIGGRSGKPRPFVVVWSARRNGAVSVDKQYLVRLPGRVRRMASPLASFTSQRQS